MAFSSQVTNELRGSFAFGRQAKQVWPAFVERVLVPEATASVSAAKTLLEFRDAVEAFVERVLSAEGLYDSGANAKHIEQVIEALLKNLKASKGQDSVRQDLCIACIRGILESQQQRMQFANASPKFINFALRYDVVAYLQQAIEVSKVRPVLSVPPAAVDAVVRAMSKTPDASMDKLREWAAAISTTLLPVLALYSWTQGDALKHVPQPACLTDLDVDDVFINVPLPKVFGAPCPARDYSKKAVCPKELVKPAKQALDVKNAVLSSNGFLTLYSASDRAFVKTPHKSAGLVAALPGVPGFFWCLNPETNEASVCRLRQERPAARSIQMVLEFSIDAEPPASTINWIDCQRDAEGAIVLMWGALNSVTGNIADMQWAVIDEAALLDDDAAAASPLTLPEDQQLVLPPRNVRGIKVDYRDHGNLLSLVRTTAAEYDEEKGCTSYQHTMDVLFGSQLLWTTVGNRPLHGVFGSPTDMIVLSPCSSEPLQRWTYNATGNCFECTGTAKLPNGNYQGLTVLVS